jgi:hypothetical protein
MGLSGIMVAMTTWQMPERSIRRNSFRNATCRDGDSADSGSSKIKMPWRLQRSLKKRRNPSPCEWERNSGGRRHTTGFQCGLIQIARYREKAFGAEKPAVGDLRQPARTQRLRQPPAHGLDCIRAIDGTIAFATAGIVISGKRYDSLKQGRFAGAVLANDDGDRAIEAKFEAPREKRHAERIGRRVADPRTVEPDTPQIRCRQIDYAFSLARRAPDPVFSLPRTEADEKVV